MLFEDKVLDISQVLRFFQSISAQHGGNLSIYYEMLKSERSDSRGIVELEPDSAKILKFFEKPDSSQTTSRLASVVFYCLRKETLVKVDEYLGPACKKKFYKFLKTKRFRGDKFWPRFWAPEHLFL